MTSKWFRKRRKGESQKAYKKAYKKAWEQLPKRKAYNQSPKRKARLKELNQSPKRKAYRKVYAKSSKGKARIRAWNRSAKAKASNTRWRQSPKGKAWQKAYEQTHKRKAAERNTSARLHLMRALRDKKKLKNGWPDAGTIEQKIGFDWVRSDQWRRAAWVESRGEKFRLLFAKTHEAAVFGPRKITTFERHAKDLGMIKEWNKLTEKESAG
jgi:hypothetical protein